MDGRLITDGFFTSIFHPFVVHLLSGGGGGVGWMDYAYTPILLTWKGLGFPFWPVRGGGFIFLCLFLNPLRLPL
jgi:hypothetical protein